MKDKGQFAEDILKILHCYPPILVAGHDHLLLRVGDIVDTVLNLNTTINEETINVAPVMRIGHGLRSRGNTRSSVRLPPRITPSSRKGDSWSSVKPRHLIEKKI